MYPPGLYFEGLIIGGFMRFEFGGLKLGGAYIWRDLFRILVNVKVWRHFLTNAFCSDFVTFVRI